MRILRTYWKTLTQSASNPSYYRDVLSAPLRFSVLFFVFSVCFLSIFSPLIWRIREYPQLYTAISQQIDTTVTQIPESATFHYEAGRLTTTGIETPFLVESVQSLQDLSVPKKLLAILVDGSETQASINLYSQKAVLAETDTMEKQEVLYSDLESQSHNFTLTGQSLRDRKGTFLQSLERYIHTGLLLSIPFLFIGYLVTNTFTLLVFSIVTQVLFWLAGIKIKYKKAFQVGLHALPISLFVDGISKLLFGQTDLSLVTPAFFGILILVVWEIRRQKGSLYG